MLRPFVVSGNALFNSLGSHALLKFGISRGISGLIPLKDVLSQTVGNVDNDPDGG